VAFVIPGFNHGITWYGILFALAFLGAYFFVRYLFFLLLLQKKEDVSKSTLLADRLTLLVALGTLVGARLGHVFFYDWPYYQAHPGEIFKVWQGGLASHGSALGILVAIAIFVGWVRRRYPFITYLFVLDALMIPTAFAGGCIRIGNFINQEILGTPTTLPWGVIFLHPVEGIAAVPLHPVQLYEALFYFCTALFLFILWKRDQSRMGSGFFAGLFFILVFVFRFCIEFIKLPQSQLIDESFLQIGQWLSLPLVLFGIVLLIYSYKRRPV